MRRILLILSVLWMAPVASFSEEIPSDRLVVQAKIPKGGDFMGFGFDSLWMMSGESLVRVDPTDNSITEIELNGGDAFRAMGIGEGAVWIPALRKRTIFKVDPIANKLVQQIPAEMADNEGSIGVGEGGVWVMTAPGSRDTILTRFDPQSGAVVASIELPSNGTGVVVDFGSVWVAGTGNGELYRIDPKTNSIVSTTKLNKAPRFIASGEGSIWVVNQGDGTVQRVDGNTGELQATIETGFSLIHHGDIVCGGGYVWVSTLRSPVVQIDPRTNTLTRVFIHSASGDILGDAIRYGADSLWVSGPAIHRIAPLIRDFLLGSASDYANSQPRRLCVNL